MPIYEFKCNKCSKSFEILIGTNEKSKPKCPTCGSESTERLLSVFCTSSPKGNVACGPAGST